MPKQQKITRRQFVKGAAIVTAGAAAGGLAACAQSPTATPAPPPPTAMPPTQAPVVVTATPVPAKWDLTADVVILGAGGAGLPAALAAQEGGASVIVVDANYDVGGHAIVSGGNVHIGGGNPGQTAAGVKDSPDLVFKDLTDWTIVEPNGAPDYRYNDPGFIRALADNSVATYNLIVANGVKFLMGPTTYGSSGTGNSAARSFQPKQDTGPAGAYSPNATGGTSYVRPLEASARSKGVKFLLNYKMTSIIRETIYPTPSGNVLGVVAQYTGGRTMPGSTTPLKSYAAIQGLPGNIDQTNPTLNIKANKAVIIATGGHTSNVNFRRIFDPRLTEQLTRVGDPFSFTDASGELAAMAIGASLWGASNQVLECMSRLRGGGSLIGTRYTAPFQPTSPVFPLAGGVGLPVSNKQDIILVNQVGERFYDETKSGNYPSGNTGDSVKPYTPDYYLNSQYIMSSLPPGKPYDATSYNFSNAALAINSASAAPDYSAGAVWAIFDADAVTREKWKVTPPNVDIANGYFFSANTLAELAAAIKNPYQAAPMSGATLQATVTRYNSFVDSGVDSDFGKPKPLYKIQTPPFYAGWSTPYVHDSYAGLRINMKMQVVDLNGQVIPHLYCAGESAGGIHQHGLGRVSIGGYIAAKNAVLETPPT